MIKSPPATDGAAVHTPHDPEAEYVDDHRREREERRQRRAELKKYRVRLMQLPINHMWEVPGRPGVVFSIRAYSIEGRNLAEQIWKHPESQFIKDAEGRTLIQFPPGGRDYIAFEELVQKQGKALARDELPFLFKAFELGQKAPPRPGTKKAELPRAATIHEYLDWTVTASEPEDPDELDFGGFRTLLLTPRFKLLWPPPSMPYVSENPLAYPEIGAPLPPIPHLCVNQKPICAATVRVGPQWMEIPFVATLESRRNKGNGRAMVECIEDICRTLNIPYLLLCSTDDSKVKKTWARLGFEISSKDILESIGVTRHDMLHMDNTVQMHKRVPPPRPMKSLLLRHQSFKHRLYYVLEGSRAPEVPPDLLERLKNVTKLAGMKKPPKKPPKKKARRR